MDGTCWNVLANNAFAACYNMRNGTQSTLGSNSLDPHLMLNSDWGAVVYLQYSNFGHKTTQSVSLNQDNGPSNLTNTINFYSSTGNASGIMNWYASSTYNSYRLHTAAIVSDNISNTTPYSGMSYFKDYAETKYIEIFPTSFTDLKHIGIGLSNETNLGFSEKYTSFSEGASILRIDNSAKMNIFPNAVGNYTYYFRPVIWNH